MSLFTPRAADSTLVQIFNRCCGFLLAILAFTSIAFTASAQTAATGTIRGRVLNASSGTYLKNVAVTDKTSGREAFTDEFGNYQLSDVPAGEATLMASYIGEPNQTATVNVAAGAVATQDFTFRSSTTKVLQDGTVVLDPFTVNSERYKNAAAIAIAEERQSINIKNVVSAEQFGDIPSANIGEFVKFLPGVQVSYGNYGGARGVSENDASGISVRGFGPEDTAILIDGFPVSNASPGSLTRQVGLDMLAITNASRVELIKVATPDMPNNSIGGQINLITKSAFEYAKPTYTARVYFNFNSLSGASLSKTPGPVNKSTYKTTPGLDFSVTYPLSSTFGFSITGHAAREFDTSYRAQPTWSYDKTASNFSATIGGTKVYVHNSQGDLAIDNPMLTRFQITETPRLVDKRSANLKLDWRPTPSQTLSANFQYSDYEGIEAERRLDFLPQYQPLSSSATLADFGPTFSTSAVEKSATSSTRGRAKADMTVTTIDKVGNTKSGYLRYNFSRGGWNISAATSISRSDGRYIDHENGHYSGLDMSSSPGRVDFSDIQDGVPGTIVTYATNKNGGQPFDYTDLSQWKISNVIAQSAESFSRNTIGLYKADVERTLDFLPFLGSNSLSIKVGARRDEEKTEKWGFGTGYRDVYTGPGLTSEDVLDTTYVGRSPGYGQPAQQWASTYKLFDLNKESEIFAQPSVGFFENEAVNNWNSYVGQQKTLKETKDAGYAMLTGRFLHNRLSFIGGLRKERNSRKGRGPFTNSKWNYAQLPDGTLYHDTSAPDDPGVRFDNSDKFLTDAALHARLIAAGVDVPDHKLGSTGTDLESAMRQRQANHPIDDSVSGKPSLSFSTAFELTKKINLQAAWSRSFGLPDLEDGTNGVLSGNGSFTLNENVTIPADGTVGTIKVANPGLPPSVSDNLDFQVSYYTDSGGKFSVSAYMKKVTNQPQTYSTYSDNPFFDPLLRALGLDPAVYDGWKVDTTTVSDTVQKTHGFEFEVRQDFGFLGGWGRHWQTFASYTVKSLGQPSAAVPYTITTPNGTEITVTPTGKTINMTANHFAAAGLQFSSRRFSVQVRGTYRNDNEISGTRTLVKGSDTNYLRRFEPAETRIDVNASYMISDKYSLFISGRDVTNSRRKIILRDDEGLLPSYAQTYDKRQFGITWTVGVNGRF